MEKNNNKLQVVSEQKHFCAEKRKETSGTDKWRYEDEKLSASWLSPLTQISAAATHCENTVIACEWNI